MFLAKVYVTLKKSVLDPQGVTIKHALDSLGYNSIDSVRMGKYFEVKINEADKKTADNIAKEICDKLLVNPVIEEYRFDIEKI